ncbi:PREDICTED: protein YLS3-like [Ipomoea nil]|uniref:protein YLS3-like n=1 Tax=Ipomoea nil TaxID=35883 RepID=UPI000901A8DD|nr:PREDICTED: protein YLS3-like [Ipomoea nil]
MGSLKILCFLLCLMVGGVSSDFAQDKKRCQDQLIGLSPCLTFVSGDAKFPTTACCDEIRKDLKKTRLCLCVLVKDRNEPGLGLKINGTLALSLPSLCRAPTNVSECLTLLHLPPNSPDAKIFEEFSSSSVSGNNTSTGDLNASSSTALFRKRWIDLLQAHAGFSLLLLIVTFIGVL